jgi:hypothetical protein
MCHCKWRSRIAKGYDDVSGRIYFMQFHAGGSTNLIFDGEFDIARIASEHRNKGRTTWAKSKMVGQTNAIARLWRSVYRL